MLSVEVSQISLALIRFIGVILFFDLYLHQREKRFYVLSLGWLFLTLSPMGRLLSGSLVANSDPANAIYHVSATVSGLLAIVGFVIVVFGALFYFTDINPRIMSRFGATGFIFLVLVYLSFPVWTKLITIGFQTVIFVGALITIIFNRDRFLLITKSNGYWLVAAVVISLIQTTIYLFGGFSGSTGETYAYPVTIMVSLIWIIFFVRLEASITEKALRESEIRFRSLIEQASDGIFITDRNGKYIDVNSKGCTMLGYSREEILGKTMKDLAAADELAEKPFRLDELQNGKTVLSERNLVRKDGLILPVEISAKMLPDGNLQGITRDITERKQAIAALQESELRFRQLYELAPLGYQSLDDEGNIIDINQAWLDTFGYSPEEVIGKWFGDFLTPEYKLNFKKRFPIFKESGSIYSEFEFFHKNGTKLFVGIDGRIGKDHRGNFKQTHCILKDITDQQNYEDEILKLNAELEQRVEERTKELKMAQDQLVRQERLAVLGQLSGSVGHELRNPLSVIKNAVYFLNHIVPDADEKIKTYLGIIEQETQTSEKIITDLLDFSRIKSVEREPFAAVDLVHQTIDRFPVPASIKVTCSVPAELPAAFIDPKQMVQVLGNLITNAYQAMPEGGELFISAAAQGDTINLMIKDTGAGISAENMPKIFEPLFTTKAKGIGLGLAVSKKLVEANEGLIEVQSTEGLGTEFIISLPIFSEHLQ